MELMKSFGTDAFRLYMYNSKELLQQYTQAQNKDLPEYKVTSEACRDEFGLLSKEVIDEVQAWNEEIIRGKTMQHDPWIGAFVPDVYDQFELIDYTKYNKE